MLPVGKGQSELWQGERLLGKVEHEVISLDHWLRHVQIRLVKFKLDNFISLALLEQPGLTLRLADGNQYPLPRPIVYVRGAYMECCSTVVA